MKTAIISLTIQGANLGQRIKLLLEEDTHCYEKSGRNSGLPCESFEKLSELMSEVFKSYDRILCIMSTGIVIRVIAPFIVHKSKDPAILVMDELGQNIISLLSGHLGGANEWTLELAEKLDSNPVITTATDVNKYPAPDVLARKLNFKIDNFNDLVKINSAIVNGDKVSYFIDSDLIHCHEYIERAKEYGIKLNSIKLDSNCFVSEKSDFYVIITDKIVDISGVVLFLRPPTMVVGIGCRRGTSTEEIKFAVESSCQAQKRSIKSIFAAASVYLKKDEKGLLDYMRELNIPISFYAEEDIKRVIAENNIIESDFVKTKLGVGNICETTAILQGKSQDIIQPKTIYPKTTVAIVQANWLLWELDQAITIK